MTKKSSQLKSNAVNADGAVRKAFLTEHSVLDPNLSLLFASSAGPVKPPVNPHNDIDRRPMNARPLRHRDAGQSTPDIDSESGDDEILSSVEGDLEDGLGSADLAEVEITAEAITIHGSDDHISKRKRKRRDEDDDIEGNYMLQISKEEERDEAFRQAKARKLEAVHNSLVSIDEKFGNEVETSSIVGSENGEGNEKLLNIPQHESLAPGKEAVELEKSSRTVFLSNVSTEAIRDKKMKKVLLKYLESILDSLPTSTEQPNHKVESIRFRSTAFSDSSLPKKAAYVTKALMDATTKSTNAYVVYSTTIAAREAVKRLNGTVVLDRHLRVDSVAHPSKIDHHRCVFVGNLGFVDDEKMLTQEGDTIKKRSKAASDTEEGLWRQFSKAGTVESVRVIRDEKTRVGKGIAYVQFQDPNSVEAALLFHDKKFPPMLPRALRVTRAKALKKTASASHGARASSKAGLDGRKKGRAEHTYTPKLSSKQLSFKGRAEKLLGKAGAASLKVKDDNHRRNSQNAGFKTAIKSPEEIVFEGHRAAAKSGMHKMNKDQKGTKRKTRPTESKRSKRAADWKKKGSRTGN